MNSHQICEESLILYFCLCLPKNINISALFYKPSISKNLKIFSPDAPQSPPPPPIKGLEVLSSGEQIKPSGGAHFDSLALPPSYSCWWHMILFGWYRSDHWTGNLCYYHFSYVCSGKIGFNVCPLIKNVFIAVLWIWNS